MNQAHVLYTEMYVCYHQNIDQIKTPTPTFKSLMPRPKGLIVFEDKMSKQTKLTMGQASSWIHLVTKRGKLVYRTSFTATHSLSLYLSKL